MPQQRPPGEELVQARLGVLDAALGQAELPLEVLWQEHLVAHHPVGQPGRVRLERPENRLQDVVARGGIRSRAAPSIS